MKVYVKIDTENRIIAVNSGNFLSDLSGWTEIDEGEGDRYNLAQSHYFPLTLTDESGIYRYKLVDGNAVERSAEEMAADRAEIVVPAPEPTTGERLDALEAAMLEMIMGGA